MTLLHEFNLSGVNYSQVSTLAKSKVVKNIVYMTFVQFANYIAPLFILPYLSRVIGLDGVGIVAITLSMSALAFILTDFGFAISSPAWIAQNSKCKEEISIYITNVVAIKCGLIFIACAIFVVHAYFFDSILSDWKIGILILFIFISQGFQMTWIFQGLEKMKNITICTVITKGTYLIFVMIFVEKSNGVSTTIACFLVSNILSTLIGFTLIRKEGIYFTGISFITAKSIFKSNISFFLSRVAVGVYSNASTLIVGSFAGIHQAALYSSAEKLYQGITSLSAPVSQALYPHLAKTKDVKLLIKFIVSMLPFMVIGGGVCLYYPREILTLIYGQSFADADKILSIFILTSIVSIVSINFGYPAYSTVGRLDIVNKSVMLGGGLQLLLLTCLFFLGEINALNVVLSIFLVEIIILLFRVIIYSIIYNKLKRKIL